MPTGADPGIPFRVGTFCLLIQEGKEPIDGRGDGREPIYFNTVHEVAELAELPIQTSSRCSVLSLSLSLSLFRMVIGKWAMGQAAGEGLKLGFKKNNNNNRTDLFGLICCCNFIFRLLRILLGFFFFCVIWVFLCYLVICYVW